MTLRCRPLARFQVVGFGILRRGISLAITMIDYTFRELPKAGYPVMFSHPRHSDAYSPI